MTSLLRAKDVINVENVITILIVVAIVLHALARLCQNTARVTRRLVFEAGVADSVCCRELHRERLEGLRQVG